MKHIEVMENSRLFVSQDQFSFVKHVFCPNIIKCVMLQGNLITYTYFKNTQIECFLNYSYISSM